MVRFNFERKEIMVAVSSDASFVIILAISEMTFMDFQGLLDTVGISFTEVVLNKIFASLNSLPTVLTILPQGKELKFCSQVIYATKFEQSLENVPQFF